MLHVLAPRGSLIAVLAALIASYAALVVTAVIARPIAFGLALVIASVLDLVIERRFRPVVLLLRRAQIGISHRAFAQIFLLLLLVAITDANRDMSRAELLTISIVALIVPVSRIGYLGLLTLVGAGRCRRSRSATSRFRPPCGRSASEAPHRRRGDAADGSRAAAGAGGGVQCPAERSGRSGGGRLLHHRRRARACCWSGTCAARPPSRRQELLDGVSAALHAPARRSCSTSADHRTSSTRQTCGSDARADAALECAPGPSTARDPQHRTYPRADRVHPARRRPDELRVARRPDRALCRERRQQHPLPARAADQARLRRARRQRQGGSFNPFSKVYDEIWVAGPAGRERYARAQVGVRDEDIVEVGRPQLDVLQRRTARVPAPTGSRPLTVLYLPTWEGWTDDDFQTSLTVMGPALVRRLLESPVPVRLIYKPHPLTGTRDPGAARADTEIRDLIAAADQPSTAPLRRPAGPARRARRPARRPRPAAVGGGAPAGRVVRDATARPSPAGTSSSTGPAPGAVRLLQRGRSHDRRRVERRVRLPRYREALRGRQPQGRAGERVPGHLPEHPFGVSAASGADVGAVVATILDRGSARRGRGPRRVPTCSAPTSRRPRNAGTPPPTP